jgi:hypothetical protein
MSQTGETWAEQPRVAITTEPRSAEGRAADLRSTVPLAAMEMDPTLKRPAVTPPTPRPRLPQKRFASLLVALVIVILANVALEFGRGNLDTLSDGYFGLQRIQQCESLGRVPDVIFAGSSRTVYGVSPQVVDATILNQTSQHVLSCNLATFGSTIDHDYFMLKKLIEDGYTPKVLVENAWEYTLNVKAAGSSDGRSAADRGSIMFDEAPYLANLSDLSDVRQVFKNGSSATFKTINFAASRLLPMYGDRYGILQALCNGTTIGPCSASLPGTDAVSTQRYLSADAYGFVPLVGQSLGSLTTAQYYRAGHGEYPQYTKNLQNFTVGGQQITYLKQLIALAQAHHVQVVLVTSPLDPVYFDYLPSPSVWDDVIAPYWRKVAAESHITYYDESHATGYNDYDWWDPEHLDAAGAYVFSTWLATNVVEPRLKP